MIYAIWYPSGGFGHFINAMISMHGENFCRPCSPWILGKDGNSHSAQFALPEFANKNKDRYRLPEIDPNMNYGVLIDNGINDEKCDFLQYFPKATPIKICYDDWSWPVIAQSHVIKAMRVSLESVINVESRCWPDTSNWAKREKFFLYLKDHELRHRWKIDNRCKNLQIKSLCRYQNMRKSLQNMGIQLDDFQSDWHKWWGANRVYFAPVIKARSVIAAVKNRTSLDLSDITDLWTQAVIFYFIWLHFDKEVPHNDFADFFIDTDQIQKWLKL